MNLEGPAFRAIHGLNPVPFSESKMKAHQPTPNTSTSSIASAQPSTASWICSWFQWLFETPKKEKLLIQRDCYRPSWNTIPELVGELQQGSSCDFSRMLPAFETKLFPKYTDPATRLWIARSLLFAELLGQIAMHHAVRINIDLVRTAVACHALSPEGPKDKDPRKNADAAHKEFLLSIGLKELAPCAIVWSTKKFKFKDFPEAHLAEWAINLGRRPGSFDYERYPLLDGFPFNKQQKSALIKQLNAEADYLLHRTKGPMKESEYPNLKTLFAMVKGPLQKLEKHSLAAQMHPSINLELLRTTTPIFKERLEGKHREKMD